MTFEESSQPDASGIFGIDLGTTYSVIARIDELGKSVVIRDQMTGDEATPSVVYYETETNTVVGDAAKEAALTHPDQVVSLVKREMGTKGWQRDFFGSPYSAPAVSASILAKLKQYAEQSTDQRVEKVVITVPAYFGLLEREATRQAGEIAGLDVIGIIPEPVAAALQYVDGTDQAKTVLVYDLGGGTFDVSIMSISTGNIEVLVTDGDHRLGGADWDQRLSEHLTDAAVEQLGTDAFLDDDGFVQEIKKKAEDTKRRLSQRESETVQLRYGGDVASIDITREEFESLTSDKLKETIDVTERALDTFRASYPGQEIDQVLLVGGSSLMPAVAEALRERFGWDPKLSDPHLAVAKGAAVYAAARSVWELVTGWEDAMGTTSDAGDGGGAIDDAQLEEAALAVSKRTGVSAEKLEAYAQATIVNALPKAIGVELVDSSDPSWQSNPDLHLYVEHLIPANTQLPYSPDTFVAGTLWENQEAVEIKLYEQAGPVADRDLSSNHPVQDGAGVINLKGHPLPAGSPIHIDIHCDSEGMIELVAIEPTSGERLSIEVQMSLLSREEVAAARSLHMTRTVSA